MGTAIRRLMCIVLVLITLFSLVPESMVTVHAAYENTHRNTGDQRADLIGVALTQVGYREGSRNYTKYGVWYGSPNMAWCGAFISWCANQAGIPSSIMYYHAYCPYGVNWFRNQGAFSMRQVEVDLTFPKQEILSTSPLPEVPLPLTSVLYAM
jgi:hypothetical protein